MRKSDVVDLWMVVPLPALSAVEGNPDFLISMLLMSERKRFCVHGSGSRLGD